ncbi:three-Cys-motif partner protein TcmP [Kineothrix sedimenti]|uniref:Three-Cys-motif partner protein TcmP n=1 Tax=Kineothrix sedimenti TaxID=3123317 RepID=A0ABZ3EVT1_9FIRM
MGSEQKFGGDWTIEKLDIFSSYLEAYLKALKNFKFKKVYIDAFAGTGNITSRDGAQMIAGSARIALSSQLQFDKYYFIEADTDKAAALQKMVDTEFTFLKHKVTILAGDANNELSKICRSIDWRYNRALLFLDPYATQVAWITLENVAKTEAIDVWYLFPFQALQRLLRKDGQLDSTWVECIDRLLGDHEWQTEFYKEDPQLNLFGTTSIVKDINTEGLKEYIFQRLQKVFPAVAPKPRVFRNTKQSPIFLFCFAVASKNEAAQRLALRIANHILKEKL